MPGVFVSYRRSDASGYARLVYNELARRFGRRQVFMDIDTLRPGVEYGEEINTHVGRCDVLVALIGPRWLSATNADGGRRLDDPADWVRSEVSAALARDIRVIPVLFDDAPILKEADLPEGMKALAGREVLELTSRHSSEDLHRLADAIADELRTKRGGSLPIRTWAAARDRWGLGRLAAAGTLAAVGLVAIAVGLTRLGNDTGEVRQFASSVDTILATSRRSRGRVNTVFSKLLAGRRASASDRAVIADVVDNRGDLKAAATGLIAPTDEARPIRQRLIAAFDLSLRQDVQIQSCTTISGRQQIVSCAQRAASMNDAATNAKNEFVASFNRMRAKTGPEPVAATF